MSNTSDTTNHKKMTVKFSSNWNNKLYCKYFQTIRAKDYFIEKDDFVEIELAGKGIFLARCIETEIVKFNEIPQNFVMCDTGLSYGDSLELFIKFGINVKSFDTEVKLCMFESFRDKPKP